jgi:ketosteroid isomerase-like protein
MASANVDLVRSIFTDWERGNFFSRGSAEWAHPEIEFVIADGPEPGSSVGPVEVSETLRGYLTAWEDFRMLADEYRELDAERVLVLFRRSGRGQHSGVEVWQFGTQGAWVFHIRGGRITKVVGYFDWERAFGDLGLLPESDPTAPA